MRTMTYRAAVLSHFEARKCHGKKGCEKFVKMVLKAPHGGSSGEYRSSDRERDLGKENVATVMRTRRPHVSLSLLQR